MFGKAISNDNGYVISFTSFGVAIALVAAYRRFVQQRPIFGPGAAEFPKRGLGVEQQRERLQKLGVDPDALRPDPKLVERARLEAMLQELHRAGLLDDDELQAKRAALDEPLASGGSRRSAIGCQSPPCQIDVSQVSDCSSAR